MVEQEAAQVTRRAWMCDRCDAIDVSDDDKPLPTINRMELCNIHHGGHVWRRIRITVVAEP